MASDATKRIQTLREDAIRDITKSVTTSDSEVKQAAKSAQEKIKSEADAANAAVKEKTDAFAKDMLAATQASDEIEKRARSLNGKIATAEENLANGEKRIADVLALDSAKLATLKAAIDGLDFKKLDFVAQLQRTTRVQESLMAAWPVYGELRVPRPAKQPQGKGWQLVYEKKVEFGKSFKNPRVIVSLSKLEFYPPKGESYTTVDVQVEGTTATGCTIKVFSAKAESFSGARIAYVAIDDRKVEEIVGSTTTAAPPSATGGKQ